MNIASVYAAIKASQKTCDEVEVSTGLAHQVVSARMRDLAKRSRIVRTGNARLTRLGCRAMVWRAVK